MKSFQIIPVIDIMNGEVVRAIGGRRAEYKPVVSKLTQSTDPTVILDAMLKKSGADVAYVADLDAIMNGTKPSPATLQIIEFTTVPLWIDFGVRTIADLESIPANQKVIPVIGTETMEGIEVARAAVKRFQYVIVSIDVREGMVMGKWQGKPADDVVSEFFVEGISDFLLIDLSAVGMGRSKSKGHFAKIQSLLGGMVRLYIGGGIANRQEMKTFQSSGAAGVLIASALHDGTLP